MLEVDGAFVGPGLAYACSGGGMTMAVRAGMMTIMHLRPNPGTTVNTPPRLSIELADSIPICLNQNYTLTLDWM
jgi:hypothetical protein